jgi:type I restriction enzyme M protein
MEKNQLQEIIKNCKKILETDQIKELKNQIPQYSWILLLKLFDHYEEERSLLDKNFVTGIPKNFRWGDWADTGDNSLTGKPLETFVSTKLFPTLSELMVEKGAESRQIIVYAFSNFKQGIGSGTNMRLVVDEINKIKLDEPDTIPNLCEIYTEELLAWANDAEKNAYFFTPRPICKFIVSVIKPNFKNNERVFDPASGLGGFLLESYDHMKKDVGPKEDLKKLRYDSLIGQDKNPDFFLCGVLNMMLNGIDTPNLLNINSLSRPTKEILPEGEYEIVMSNPSYNEKEAKSIADNLPYEIKTGETALHFLFLAMEELKNKGRGAIIVPNGPLFKHGKADVIKNKLLDEFNLHTIIRLPKSIFKPRTDIDTNILFFEKGTPTKEIWFYNLPLPKRLEDETKKKKNLSFAKGKPVLDEDFVDLLKWIDKKEENEYAWKVSVDEIRKTNDKGKIEVNLDVQNPKDVDTTPEKSPHELIGQIIEDERKTLTLLEEVEQLIQDEIPQ